MIKLGTPVHALRWDLSVEELVPHVGVVIEHLPHRSGDCYALATSEGLILEVLTAQTRAFTTLDEYVDAIEARL